MQSFDPLDDFTLQPWLELPIFNFLFSEPFVGTDSVRSPHPSQSANHPILIGDEDLQPGQSYLPSPFIPTPTSPRSIHPILNPTLP